jgi:hypothetical protein
MKSICVGKFYLVYAQKNPRKDQILRSEQEYVSYKRSQNSNYLSSFGQSTHYEEGAQMQTFSTLPRLHQRNLQNEGPIII